VLKQLVPRAGKKAGKPSLKLRPALKLKATASSKPSAVEKERRKNQTRARRPSRPRLRKPFRGFSEGSRPEWSETRSCQPVSEAS